MTRLSGFDKLAHTQGCVLSIGNFDGVHKGHQAIVASLVALGKRLQLPAVVMTFEPPPSALLSPAGQPPRLTTPQKKAELLAAAGVEDVVEYPTDWDLLKLTPREFFDQIVVNRLRALGLVEGPTFFFGRGRAGNGETLKEFSAQAGIRLEIVQPELINGKLVSSSVVREAIARGDVQQAESLLGRRYALTGVVSRGAQRGRTMGFPTANLEQIETLFPADGVYAALATVQGRQAAAAVSIGPNPTFSEVGRKVEAHLLDLSGDFYGEEMELKFVSKLRGLKKFSALEELQSQISEDVTLTRLAVDVG